MILRRLYLSILVTFAFAFSGYSSHVQGGYISYNCIAPGQYEITMTLYNDCSGINPPTNPSITIEGCGTTQNLTLTQQSITEVSQLCQPQLVNSTCNGGNLPGVEEVIYTATVNLPPCDCYTMSYSLCCRNTAVNVQNSQSTTFYIETTLCSQTAPCNTSPVFTAQPIPYVCTNEQVIYNFGASEPDGHTLVYNLVSSMTNNGQPVTYNGGFTGANPIPGITINNNNGLISFTPTQVGNFIVVVEVEEYDANGNLISTTVEELQFVVQNCTSTNNPPDPNPNFNLTSANGYTTGNNDIILCQGDDFCVDLEFTDADPGDILTLTTNATNVLPGATVNVVGTNPATMTVCWTAPPTANGLYSFTIQSEDDACPINSFTNTAVDVTVIGSTVAGPNQTICGNQSAQINASGGTVFNWSVISGDPINVGANFSCNPCANPIASPSQTTVYEVTSDLTGSCVNVDTVTITVVPDFGIDSVTYNNTSCLLEDIDINTFVSPNQAYTYSWDPPANLSDPTIPNPVATFGQPGTYDFDVTITSPQGCVKVETVSINVNNNVVPDISILMNDTTICEGDVIPGPGYMEGQLNAQPPTMCAPSLTTTCAGAPSTSTTGPATGQNTATNWPSPYGNWYRNAKHQFLFRANELVAAGMGAGKITEIAWETVAQNTATNTFNGYTIKIGCTANTELTTWETGLTQVFNPKTVNVNLGWNTHNFDTAYEWDGVSNLVVEICYDNLATTYTRNWSTPWETMGYNSTLYYYSDSQNACQATTQNFNSPNTNRPITRFNHCLVNANPNDYTWTWTPTNGLVTPNDISTDASPSTTTTYQLVAEDIVGGCTDTAFVTINVNSVEASPDTVICAGQPVQLDATPTNPCPTGTPTYTWTPATGLSDPNIQNPVATPMNSTQYVVEYNDGCGCVTTDTVNVDANGTIETFDTLAVCQGDQILIHGNNESTAGDYVGNFVTTTGCDSISNVHLEINPLPTVTAPADETLCDGDNLTLSGAGTATTYTWDNGVNDGVQFTPPLGTTIYTVTGTDANGCENTDQVEVTVNPNPTPTITGSITYCPGTNVTLDAGAGFTSYLWSNGASTQTSQFTDVDNPITVTVTDANGCEGTSPSVNVNESNTVIFNDNIEICQGESVVIHGQTQTTAGTYSETYVIGPGCDSIANITLIVNPLPNVNAGNDVDICEGNQVTITATGADTYTWSGGIQNGVTFTPTATGTTTYTVTGGNTTTGCTNTDDVVVTVNPQPNVDAGPDITVCEGESVTLTGTGATTLSWDNGVQDGVTFTPSVGTVTYTLTGTSGSGCTDSDEVTVTVAPIPNVDAGNDISICEGDEVILSGSGADSYSWDNGVVDGVPFTPNQTTTYTVTGTTNFGCTETDQVTIEVNPVPEPSFVSDNLSGCAPLTADFTNTTPLLGGETCQWQFGDGTVYNGCDGAARTYNYPGCYNVSLTITSADGCAQTTTYDSYICVNPDPVANFNFDPALPTTTETTITFNNFSTGASEYEWSFGDVGSSDAENPVQEFPAVEGDYPIELIAISEDGCRDTSNAVLTMFEDLIFYVPNTFTPDQDGFNETFTPVMTSGFEAQEYRLLIFNRWGEVIFESRNPQIGWDGTFKGKVVKDGTYVWKIDLKVTIADERKEYYGHVNVLR